MRKNYRDLFYLKFGARLGSSMMQNVAASSVLLDYVPAKTKLPRKHAKKPPLEKIGGMEKEVRSFFSQHIELNSDHTSILRASTGLVVEALNENMNAIINLKSINELKEINDFFCEVNGKLLNDGLFGCCVEPKNNGKIRIFKTYPPVVSHIYYICFFIFHRMFPKLPVTSNIYFYLTGGTTPVMSKTEVMGRLYACGFQFVDEKRINDKYYFVFRKARKPIANHNAKYGAIFKMRRHGKNGKIIYVYKLRTMDAYSEYLQHYVYEKNNLAEGGKLKNDFRVSTLGRFFRKYWIDELPMILNVLKGDLKIVGVRPLSSHYLSLYSEELREKRIHHKPGLIPPFYVDMPKSLDEIMKSEMRYLDAHEKHPFLTDVKYFFLAFYTIVIKRARSK